MELPGYKVARARQRLGRRRSGHWGHRLAGYGPTFFAGLSKRVDLKLVSRFGVRLGGGGDAV